MPNLTMTTEEAIQLAFSKIEKLEAQCQAHETTLAAIMTIFANEKLTPDRLLPAVKGMAKVLKHEFPMTSVNLQRIVDTVERSSSLYPNEPFLKLVPEIKNDDQET